MSYVIRSQAAAPPTGGWLRLQARLRHALGAFWREWRDAWARAAARREFDRLDSDALRDLGISRSEFDSYWAETHGLAPRTRERVPQCSHGRSAS